MSILKGILHHWNKTSSAYDTIHPETEVAQVTDWNKGIVNTLASTGLSSLVNVLSSDSLLALLIKKVFDAMGVKYSLAQNGYVCWGALFGGVITQWGLSETNEYGTAWVIFPISFIYTPVVLATHNGLDAVAAYISSNERRPTQVAIVLRKIKDNSASNKWGVGWIAIGI